MVLFSQADLEAQNALDVEILRYNRLMKALCTRRNTHSIISKLPNELLSRIFLACEDVATARRRGSDRDNLAMLLTLTSVCSHWSHVARETAPLWSMISLARPSWVAEAFQRTVDNPAPRLEEVDVTLTPEDARLCGPLRYLHGGRLEGGRKKPAPLLRILAIDYESPESPRRRGLHRDVDPFVPETMQFPWTKLISLQSVTLKNIIPYEVPPMPSLTNLTIQITRSHHEHQSYISVSDTMNILRNAPAVEKVAISIISLKESHDDDFDIVPPKSPSRIPLPQLRELHLGYAYLRDSELFSVLDLPALRKSTGFFANERGDPDIEAGGDLSLLQHQVSCSIPSDVDALKLMITLNPPERVRCQFLEFPNRPFGYELKVFEDAKSGRLLFKLDISHLPLEEHHVDIVKSLPLEKITNFVLVGAKENNAEAWSNLIPLLVHLKQISVEKVQAIRTLGVAPPLPTAANQTNVSNPELQSIVLEGDGGLDSTVEQDLLVSICRFRHVSGSPVRMLIMDPLDDSWEAYEAELSKYVTVTDEMEEIEFVSDDDM